MSMYIPEIKEEVSENAEMLVVEEDGKIYRTAMPSVGNGTDVVIKISTDITTAELVSGSYELLEYKWEKELLINVVVYVHGNEGEDSITMNSMIPGQILTCFDNSIFYVCHMELELFFSIDANNTISVLNEPPEFLNF